MNQVTSSDQAARFEILFEPHRGVLKGYVHRLIGHPADAQDLVQDISLKALERFETLRTDSAFRGWLLTIATRTCIDHLRKQRRWRPFSQRYLEQECASDSSLRDQVEGATIDPEFSYDVREHIAFCFACVGLSVKPTQAAALLLREVIGLTNREAAGVLDITESVLRHHLSDARRTMKTTFDGLCSLVNKKGVCRQCSSFRNVVPEDRKGPTLPVLGDREEAWHARLAIVRESQFLDGASSQLHNVMFELIKALESKQAR